MATAQLTPTSYIVLGLVETAGDATPYELARRLAGGIGNLWPVPRSQVYAESERLAGSGHLELTQERAGRRRRTYSLTSRGSAALDLWRRVRARALPDLRDPGLLQLYFGAEAKGLASGRLAQHRARLSDYEELLERGEAEGRPGPMLALRAAVLHERASIEFWSELAAEGEPS